MKRFFDLTFTIVFLPFWGGAFLIIYIAISLQMGSPAIFKQDRGGLNGKVFKILKFRTMTDRKNDNGELLNDNERLTSLGAFLRKSSLDELPSLWNVINGQMSLVGPRPFIAEYLQIYSPEQSKRHNVRPGITGWAQVNGRNTISWEEKFNLDVWYVDNRSFWLDCKILFLTIRKVFVREGINAGSEITMPKFTGHDS